MPPPTAPVAPAPNPEAGARAAFQEKLGTTAREKRAQEIRDRQAKEGSHETIVSLANQAKIEQKPIEELNENNIGTTIDPATGKKDRPLGSPDSVRFNTANDVTEKTLKYINEGYDKLKAADPTTATFVRGEVERVMRLDAGTNAYLDSEIAAGRTIDSIIENALKDPEMRIKIREAFDLATDPSKKLEIGNLNELESKYKDADAEKGLKKSEVDRKKDELDLAQLEVDDFDDGTFIGGTGVQGKLDKDIKLLDSTRAADISGKQAREKTLASVKDQIQAHENDRQIALSLKDALAAAKAQGEITKLSGEVRKLEQEIAERGERIDRRDKLEQAKKEAIVKRRKIQEEKDKLDVEFGKLERAGLLAKANFESAKLTRTSQEDAYVNGLKNVFAEGTTKYVTDKLAKTRAAEKQLIDEQIVQAGDPAEKAILKAFGERWEKEGVGFWGGRKREFNKDQANADYDVLMGTGPGTGPEDIMRNMLNGKLTPAEVTAKLKDPAFIEKMQPQVIERVLAAKIQSGGKITEGESRIIFNKWGEELINNAIARKKGFKASIDKLREEGVLKDGNFLEQFKRMSHGNLLSFLLLLLGSVATVGALPIGIGLKNSIQEK